MDNCYKCTDSKTCKECISPYVLYNDQCVGLCPPGYYKGDKKCLNCIEGCEVCENGEVCRVCEDGYLLENGLCVKVYSRN